MPSSPAAALAARCNARCNGRRCNGRSLQWSLQWQGLQRHCAVGVAAAAAGSWCAAVPGSAALLQLGCRRAPCWGGRAVQCEAALAAQLAAGRPLLSADIDRWAATLVKVNEVRAWVSSGCHLGTPRTHAHLPIWLSVRDVGQQQQGWRRQAVGRKGGGAGREGGGAAIATSSAGGKGRWWGSSAGRVVGARWGSGAIRRSQRDSRLKAGVHTCAIKAQALQMLCTSARSDSRRGRRAPKACCTAEVRRGRQACSSSARKAADAAPRHGGQPLLTAAAAATRPAAAAPPEAAPAWPAGPPPQPPLPHSPARRPPPAACAAPPPAGCPSGSGQAGCCCLPPPTRREAAAGWAGGRWVRPRGAWAGAARWCEGAGRRGGGLRTFACMQIM